MILQNSKQILSVAASIQSLAIEENKTVATAESCTGGLVASVLTHHAGSSAYYLGGVSSYSNAAKINLLDVKPSTLDLHGAVSEQTAEEMAFGALEKFNADYAISITGIAGPSGGTEAKPVGTICFATGGRTTLQVRTVYLHQDRLSNRSEVVHLALEDLLRLMQADLTTTR